MNGVRAVYDRFLLGVAGLLFCGTGVAAEFTYSASVEAASVHPDTTPPSMLCDGKFSSVKNDAVQYNNHVRLEVDLGKAQQVRKVTLHAFQKTGDYVVGDYELLSSMDGKKWTPRSEVKNVQANDGAEIVELTADVKFDARYLMLKIHKAAGIVRVLLGELVVETSDAVILG
jgi:hypothetical protein